MKLTTIAAAVLVAPAFFAMARPTDLFQQLALDIFGSDEDPCPDLKVRCVKDGDITKVIGDIGKQGFKRVGASCEQRHKTKNTAECNAKYLKDCATKCEAWGSPI